MIGFTSNSKQVWSERLDEKNATLLWLNFFNFLLMINTVTINLTVKINFSKYALDDDFQTRTSKK